MKKLLAALFVALLVAGYGEGSLDFDDPAILDRIIAEAIDATILRKKGKEGEELLYAPNQQTPFTGWYPDGQMLSEQNYKDGKQDGPSIGWFGNGKKRVEVNYKDGQQQGIRRNWHENEEVPAMRTPNTRLRSRLQGGAGVG